MSDNTTLLFANETFYTAFASRDLAAMDELWSKTERCSCIHPGWQAVDGRAAVMETWTAILSNPQSPRIRWRNARAYPRGDLGYVVCYELVEESVLVATNLFVREHGAWRLVHHQAGASSLPPQGDEDEQVPTLQ